MLSLTILLISANLINNKLPTYNIQTDQCGSLVFIQSIANRSFNSSSDLSEPALHKLALVMLFSFSFTLYVLQPTICILVSPILFLLIFETALLLVFQTRLALFLEATSESFFSFLLCLLIRSVNSYYNCTLSIPHLSSLIVYCITYNL